MLVVWPDELLPKDEDDEVCVEPGHCIECGQPIRLSRVALLEYLERPDPWNPRRRWIYRCWCGMTVGFVQPEPVN